MTTMNPNDYSLQEQIQRLADGSLAFEERARLLRKIEGEHPENWRDVALLLVERDVLSEATRANASAKHPAASPGSWLAAACVALGCFLLGWTVRPGGAPEAVASGNPTLSVPSEPAYPVPSPSLVRAANAQLAPTGYEASLLTRYVRTNLDGREVVIPVSQVRLDYRGL